MPEIWLNYGTTEVVLDIRAENLDQKIDSGDKVMEDSAINEKLASLDLTKPIELVVLDNSKSVQKIISSLFTLCEHKSLPFPKILSDKKTASQIKVGLPEGCSVNEFGHTKLSPDLVFVGEVEFDGLFGYETISTRLVKRFGQESMLSAYSRRAANTPVPGQTTESFKDATKFVSSFEIQAIETASNSSGIVDLAIGHPSETSLVTKTLESFAVKDVGEQKSMIVSTGKSSSSENLTKSLSSVWNCSQAIKKGGLLILAAECQGGLGSDSLQQYVEGRLSVEQLKNPPTYISGMENLLYLHEIQQNFQIGIISILPEFYTNQLNMISLPGIKQSMDYILKTQGSRQKVSVISDGARLLLR